MSTHEDDDKGSDGHRSGGNGVDQAAVDRGRAVTVGGREIHNHLRNIGLRIAATGPTRERLGAKFGTARRSEVYGALEALLEEVRILTGMTDQQLAAIDGGLIGDIRLLGPLLPEKW